MIRVERPAAPACLEGLASAAAIELAASVAHYTSTPPKKESFKYTVYSSAPVKETLAKAFNNKCGYCDIDYGGAPLDVEHFRPKGAIVEIDLETLKPRGTQYVTKPGYYWLAAKWTNLLLACIHCNRPEKHAFPDAQDEVSGKSNFFPVGANTARTLDRNLDSEALEQPLLLDPCRDQPEAHLEYGPKGTIRPKTRPDADDLRARVSIRVYGLQRDPLVRRRESTQTLLALRIAEARKALAALAENPADQQARQDLNAKLAEIKDHYLAPSRPFLGMCRQMVREQLVSIVRP
jgi:uncharacterized protein (TIGR02646 family)